MLLLLRSLLNTVVIEPPVDPPPENGPSGGATWLQGYKPPHDYSPKRRRNKRDELLICRA